MKQAINAQLTYAAPTAAIQITAVSDSGYSKLKGVVVIFDNDNATATVQVQAVVSRSATPVAAALAASKSLQRGDALLLAETAAAGRAAIVGRADVNDSVVNGDELFSATGGAYLGLKAVGLESGKVCNVQVELEFADVSMTQGATNTYLEQLVRFQSVVAA
jgi:hypothetical protein